jgi:hypothetical protein
MLEADNDFEGSIGAGGLGAVEDPEWIEAWEKMRFSSGGTADQGDVQPGPKSEPPPPEASEQKKPRE